MSTPFEQCWNLTEVVLYLPYLQLPSHCFPFPSSEDSKFLTPSIEHFEVGDELLSCISNCNIYIGWLTVALQSVLSTASFPNFFSLTSLFTHLAIELPDISLHQQIVYFVKTTFNGFMKNIVTWTTVHITYKIQ